ncbi:curli production assembly protein CsgG [Colwellia sp. M166]|uniref:CsgG/HfaB family protein n=1 Tax=Colwellia sp. M166 TaxID=2583805 RepID=UPI00211E4637|nr:CsgG/HfaB family protein [Colwellia sp. M166]UUO23704.1 curli production assembly protein CsgG [Colwellia sp. M166]|tara:strand:- start:12886 stop:13563 length:678 start_codon:yes stop_codon:yes gene_type:complete
MELSRKKSFGLFLALATLVSGCATETYQKVAVTKVEANRTAYTGLKSTLVLGEFNNRSNYMQGLFSSNIDKLGNQGKTILKTHLQQTNRFKVVDRENLANLQKEAELLGVKQEIKGARYVISGGVTEFGRKVIGDKQLFGILGSGKSQIAYAKVSLNIIDVLTSEIIYSTQGAGEFQLNERQVVGFGSKAGYDATLNGKVLDFAIKESINNMTKDLENGTLNFVL